MIYNTAGPLHDWQKQHINIHTQEILSSSQEYILTEQYLLLRMTPVLFIRAAQTGLTRQLPSLASRLYNLSSFSDSK